MLDEALKPDVPAFGEDTLARPDFATKCKEQPLNPPSDLFIRVAEALHSASKSLGLFGN